MEKFPDQKKRTKQILKALEHNRNLAEQGYFQKTNRKARIEEQHWARDSTIENFGTDFYETIPDGKSNSSGVPDIEKGAAFERYIAEILSKEKVGDLTAIEFGGPGSKFFGTFPENFFRRTIGVCLKDIRKDEEIDRDRGLGHYVIEGDIMEVQNEELTRKVLKVLKVEKTDLIISRMMGPLGHLDKDPAILDRIIRRWYKILDQNGLMFIQFIYLKNVDTDPYLTDLIKKWAAAVGEMFPEVDIKVGKRTLRLHKKNGAPEELPPATQLFK